MCLLGGGTQRAGRNIGDRVRGREAGKTRFPFRPQPNISIWTGGRVAARLILQDWGYYTRKRSFCPVKNANALPFPGTPPTRQRGLSLRLSGPAR